MNICIINSNDLTLITISASPDKLMQRIKDNDRHEDCELVSLIESESALEICGKLRSRYSVFADEGSWFKDLPVRNVVKDALRIGSGWDCE